jgi:serine/threonine-protein kinase
MDFGIARIAGAPALTAAGEVAGTLAYMSPEQAEGLVAGPGSDVYSLALTAYECWAGANPVAAPSPAQTARRIGEGVPPLRERRPDLPEGLVDTIDACLDSDPALRPTALDLRDCLEDEMDRLSDAPLPAPGVFGPAAEREWPGPARMAGLCALAAVLVLIAGPLGAPGAALVLATLCLPALLIGAPAASLAAPAAPLISWIGIPGAAAVLGALGATPLARALLGAGAWAWLFTGSIAFGLGPNLGIATRAPDGWASDTSVAAESVLAPLFGLDSLIAMAIFAAAAVALGAILSLRHAAVALLGAMLWAAGVNAALAAVADVGVAGTAAGLVSAAVIAVAIEFGLRRGEARPWRGAPAPERSHVLTT